MSATTPSGGDRPQQWNDADRGQYCGYRAQVVAHFLMWSPAAVRHDP
ncbi:hypothetical protein [Streptomyces rhizosphaericus]|nr:hypothetical protein [Streptomyces rhizosphaericus]